MTPAAVNLGISGQRIHEVYLLHQSVFATKIHIYEHDLRHPSHELTQLSPR